jgi:amino-acid N-acetyltransferase
MIRRHTKGDKEIHFQPALTVVSGNYVTAKRRGVVEGTDYGLTGEVKWFRYCYGIIHVTSPCFGARS